MSCRLQTQFNVGCYMVYFNSWMVYSKLTWAASQKPCFPIVQLAEYWCGACSIFKILMKFRWYFVLVSHSVSPSAVSTGSPHDNCIVFLISYIKLIRFVLNKRVNIVLTCFKNTRYYEYSVFLRSHNAGDVIKVFLLFPKRCVWSQTYSPL